MNHVDEGGNSCKAKVRIGVKKVGRKGDFFERLLVMGYGLLKSRVKGQESRVLIKLRVKS